MKIQRQLSCNSLNLLVILTLSLASTLVSSTTYAQASNAEKAPSVPEDQGQNVVNEGTHTEHNDKGKTCKEDDEECKKLQEDDPSEQVEETVLEENVEQTPTEPGEPEELTELDEDVDVVEAAPSETSNVDDSLPIDTFYTSTRLIAPERLSRTGGAAHRFGEDELKKYEYDDPTAILQKVPGVSVRTEDGYGLRPNIGIRGAASDRSKKVTLMVDKVLFGPAPYAAPAAYFFPITSRMTGIEIFKGPAAVLYGPNTIGGSINWVTRDIPYGLKAGFDLNYGRFHTAKAHGWIGGSNDWGGFLGEAVGWRSSGFKHLENKGDTGFNKIDTMLKGRLNTNPDDSIYNAVELKVGFSMERSHETYLGLTQMDFDRDKDLRYAASQKDLMDWWRTEIELTHTLEIGLPITITTTAYRHDFDRSWDKFNQLNQNATTEQILEFPNRYSDQLKIIKGEINSMNNDQALVMGKNARRYYSQGIQSDIEWRATFGDFKNRLNAGLRFHNDAIRRHHTVSYWMMNNGEMERSTSLTGKEVTNNKGESYAISAFVQDQLDWGPLSVTPGIRIEHIRDTQIEYDDNNKVKEEVLNPYTVFIPGIGAYYEFYAPFGILAGVHRGFSPPGPTKQEGIEPEYAINYEAGFRYFDSETLSSAEVIGFYSAYQNLSGECTFASGCTLKDLDSKFNAGAVDIFGVESDVNLQFSLPWDLTLPVRAAYTFIYSTFKHPFSSKNPEFRGVKEGDQLPYLPQHSASFSLGLSHERWGNINFTGNYVSPSLNQAGKYSDNKILKTDQYFLLDATISAKVWGPIEVYGKFNNILNERPIVSFRPMGARPLAPFMFSFGVRGDFNLTQEE